MSGKKLNNKYGFVFIFVFLVGCGESFQNKKNQLNEPVKKIETKEQVYSELKDQIMKCKSVNELDSKERLVGLTVGFLTPDMINELLRLVAPKRKDLGGKSNLKNQEAKKREEENAKILLPILEAQRTS